MTPLLCASWVAGSLSRGDIMSSLHLVMSKGYRVNCMSATNSVILPKSTDAVYVSVNSVWLIVSATQHIY